MRKIFCGKFLQATVFFLLVLVGFSGTGYAGDGGVAVLMYHHLAKDGSFDEQTQGAYVLTPQRFEAQIQGLMEKGYNFIHLCDFYAFLTAGEKLPPKAILITFDDGYESNYTFAYPILQKYGVPAVINVIVGLTPPFPMASKAGAPHLTREELKTMGDSALICFGSHTYNSHRLGLTVKGEKPVLKFPLLIEGKEEDREAFERRIFNDLLLSRCYLRRFTGQDILAFAFPFGAYSQVSIEAVKRSGFKMAFTSDEGLNFAGDNPYTIKRLNVSNRDTADSIAARIEKYAGIGSSKQ